MSTFWKGIIGGLIGTLLAGALLGFSSWVALQLIDAQQSITKMGINLNSMQNVLVDRIESLSIENEKLKKRLEPRKAAAANGGEHVVDEPPEQTQEQDWSNMPAPEQYSRKGIYDDIQQQVQQQEEFTK